MDLKSVTLKGFKRFGAETYLRLDGKLIALVGPNEAGKTSLLTAISRHARGSQFEDNDASRFPVDPPEVSLHYFLNEEDADAVSLEVPCWFTVTRRKDGSYSSELSAPPKRDLARRLACKEQLDQTVTARETAKTETRASAEELQALTAILASTETFSSEDRSALKHLQSETIEQIQEIHAQAETGEDDEILLDEVLRAYHDALQDLEQSLSDLLSFESNHDPDQDALKTLMARRPEILEFTETDRELGLPFNIRAVHHQDAKQRKLPAKPLLNLMQRTGLDLETLINADNANDTALVYGLLEAANARLRDLGEGRWSQSDAQLKFILDKSQLNILVEHGDAFELTFRYNTLSERSAGYKQFIALQVFSVFHELEGAILLIDEMEQHLHYDAQADLVQMLTRDPKLGKVIYATHSAGCLPEDLGSGVKLVQWKPDDPKQSRVVNRFWGRGRTDGFSPLLFGMGAATLSFFPTRRALIAEGVTETLLLPRLLREAMAVERLDFQVVHGLSNLSPTGIPMVDTATSRVAYLTDPDPGGDAIRTGLIAVGVAEDRVFRLGDSAQLTTIEDVIDETVWLRAVNRVQQELAGEGEAPDPVESAPHSGRIADLPEPVRNKKVDLAYAVLDIAFADPSLLLIAKPHVETLRALGKEVSVKLAV